MARTSITSNSSAAEQYIVGVNGLKRRQFNNNLSVYDLFVYWHSVTMMTPAPSDNGIVHDNRNRAHNGPIFLPWHRFYLAVFEAQLRTVPGVSPQFELPYWDWSSDADAATTANQQSFAALWNAEIWDLLGRHDQFGQVLDGPFATWDIVVEPTTAGTGQLGPGRRLERVLGGARLPTTAAVRSATLIGDYDRPNWARSFMTGSHRDAVEDEHDAVHRFVGGDMTSSASPNDPIFFLHHCNVDRQWAAWQDRFSATTRADYRPQTVTDPTVPPTHVVDADLVWFTGGQNPLGFTVGDAVELIPQYDDLTQFQ